MVHVVQRHPPVLDDCCAKRTTAPDIPVTHRRRAVESALRDSGFASSSPGDRGQRPPPERPRKRDELEGVKATISAGKAMEEERFATVSGILECSRLDGAEDFRSKAGKRRRKRWVFLASQGRTGSQGPVRAATRGHRPKKGRGTEGLGPRGCKSSQAGSKVRPGTRMWSPRARVRSRQAGDSRSEVSTSQGVGPPRSRKGPASFHRAQARREVGRATAEPLKTKGAREGAGRTRRGKSS